ncbi:MAG: hypothetical protein M0R37_00120 [Bacteroidales bacterium]|nr:hypothetical protein [Bacteroidales bacterium]
MILKKYSLIIFTLLLHSVNIWAQSSTLIAVSNQDKNVKFVKMAVNTSILVNEINKAYQDIRTPLFPPGLLNEYARLKLLDFWQYRSFKIILPEIPCTAITENGSNYLRKILIQTDETTGYINICLTDNGEISDLEIYAELNPGIKIPKQLIDSKLSIVGSKPADSEKVFNINHPNQVESFKIQTNRWVFGGSLGYGTILGRGDTGYGIEASAGYKSGQELLLNTAIGFNQYVVYYEDYDYAVSKQFVSTRLGAAFYPYKGLSIEAGVVKTFGDFSAFGVTTGLGYQFFSHYTLAGRYFYYGEAEQQMLTISIGYVF